MLRRAAKRAQNKEKSVNEEATRVKRVKQSADPLGAPPDDDNDEKQLENLVLGGDEGLLDSLEQRTEKLSKKKVDTTTAPDAAWEDEDDEFRLSSGQIPAEKAKTGGLLNDKYTDTLRNRFEKISGTPSWAKLRWEKKAESDDEDSDSDDLTKRTGSFLKRSESLSRNYIQMKRCPDANQEKTSHGKLRSVEFHPSAQVILTAGMDQTLSLFQVDGKNNPKIQSVFIEKFPIHTAHFTTEGQHVIMGSRHKNFYYYDMIAGKIINVPEIKGIEETNMGKFEISPDGRFITFLGKYGKMHLISAKSKEWITSLKMNGRVEAVTYSADGSRMYSHGDEGEVYIWDMNTRQCIHRFTDEGCIKGTSLACSPNGQYLACGSYSGVVNVYDSSAVLASSSPTPIKAIMNLTTPATSLSFNSHTEILAMASDFTEKAIKLAHIPSMTVFSNFPDKTDNMRIVRCMDFSLNSGYFTIGNHKGQALLYRVKHYSNY